MNHIGIVGITYFKAKKTNITDISHFTSTSRKRRLSRGESSFLLIATFIAFSQFHWYFYMNHIAQSRYNLVQSKRTDRTVISHFTSTSRKRSLSREESSFLLIATIIAIAQFHWNSYMNLIAYSRYNLLQTKKADTTDISHFTSTSRKRRLSREESSFF